MSAVTLQVDDPRLQRLLRYWEDKRAGRRMPARADIDPKDFLDLLPHVYLVDVSYDPLVFRFRLAGSEIGHLFGEEVTGKTTDELMVVRLRSLLREHYEDVVRLKAPAFETSTFAGAKKYLVYKRLLLPLSSDGEVVDMLLGCTLLIGTHDLTTGRPTPA